MLLLDFSTIYWQQALVMTSIHVWEPHPQAGSDLDHLEPSDEFQLLFCVGIRYCKRLATSIIIV